MSTPTALQHYLNDAEIEYDAKLLNECYVLSFYCFVTKFETKIQKKN